MSRKILVLGESGSGKTTSLRNISPKDMFLINVIGKDLPFKGWKKNFTLYSKDNPNGNMYVTNNSAVILKLFQKLKELPFKYVIVDDFQYIMSYEFMERAKEKGYEKFTEIGQNAFNVIKEASNLRDDQIVIFLTHSEEIFEKGIHKIKIKTIGKMLDEKITVEGLFTVVLYSIVETDAEGLKYYFITNSDGTTPAKSPMGMFPSIKIENDLNLVLQYYQNYEE